MHDKVKLQKALLGGRTSENGEKGKERRPSYQVLPAMGQGKLTRAGLVEAKGLITVGVDH